MADKGKKDSTPPPLLFKPAGGGLTLDPPEQRDILMPVIQAEPSLFGPDDGLGEVASFVGQTPPSSSQPSLQKPPAISNLFQGTAGSSSSFQIGHGPPPPGLQGSPQGSPRQTPTPPSSHFGASGAQPPLQPPMSNPSPMGYTPPSVSTTGSVNAFRVQGPLRRAQFHQEAYVNTASLMTGPPAPIPFSQGFPTAATLEPTSAIAQPYTAPKPQGPPPPVHFVGPPPAQALPQLKGMGVQRGTPESGGYVPLEHHWCYCKTVEGRPIWYPFSIVDSLKLEDAYKIGGTQDPHKAIVATDGGRYDVNLVDRLRRAVYWEEEPTQVKRCSWFYKRELDNRYVPYDENIADRLEDEYRQAVTSGVWHKRLEFPGGETVIMHNPNVMAHYKPSQIDEWGSQLQGEQMRPRVVKRGAQDFDTVEEGECSEVDHLVFVIHGIGSVCDVRFRDLVECVDDFRSISMNLLRSHFGHYKNERRIGRVEFLPVHWHKALHGDATGIDMRLKAITLKSTPKLRHFINDTLVDILFFTSPTYCQCIADTVGNEINRIYKLFLERNPHFLGGVSVAGHSLGSCILFDLLQHQKEDTESVTAVDSLECLSNGQPGSRDMTPEITEVNSSEDFAEDDEPEMSLKDLLSRVGLQDKEKLFEQEQIDKEALIMFNESDLKDLGLPMGPRKKLQSLLKEEIDKKKKRKTESELRAKREIERLVREKLIAEQAAMRTQQLQQNTMGEAPVQKSSSITVDYVQGLAGTGQPYVKYPQLLFKPMCFFALGSPVGVFLAARGVEQLGEDFRLPTCHKVFNIFHPFDPIAYRIEPLIHPSAHEIKAVLMPHHKGRKRLHLELKESIARVGADIKQKIIDSLKSTWNSINSFAQAHRNTAETSLEEQVDSQMSSMVQELSKDDDATSIASSHEDEIHMGQLNEGRRIDYVLQERPIESFNDYVFSLSSHGCYWDSEDTVLMCLKEIYSMYGIAPQMPGPDGSHRHQALGPPPWSPNSQVPPPPSNLYSQSSVPPPNVPFSQPSFLPPVQNRLPPQGLNVGPPPPVSQSTHFGPPPMSGFIPKS
ncbi:hypothetical protein ACJMK2_005363 [Sinanodonta woodiana]|uniref:DDHD domain-containing protein n=1 Tax=Sinanodonta woodiana TaxID=1069815 RepID=A0ABD3VRE2_SINWO